MTRYRRCRSAFPVGRSRSRPRSGRPLVEHAPGKLGPIVDPQALGPTPQTDQGVQGFGHLVGAEVGSRRQRERLSCVAIDDGQHPERTPVEQAVRHEVHRPDLVRPTDGRPSLAVAPGPLALGQLGSDRQPFVPVDPVVALVV